MCINVNDIKNIFVSLKLLFLLNLPASEFIDSPLSYTQVYIVSQNSMIMQHTFATQHGTLPILILQYNNSVMIPCNKLMDV